MLLRQFQFNWRKHLGSPSASRKLKSTVARHETPFVTKINHIGIRELAQISRDSIWT